MKIGRPKAIRCQGEMTGMGDYRACKNIVTLIGNEFGREKSDEFTEQFEGAVASYFADANALAARPSARDESADLLAIVEDCNLFTASRCESVALRLASRLENFPPISRGTFSASVDDLLRLEEAITHLRTVLPRPVHWGTDATRTSIKTVIDACEKGNPIPFTKRPSTARDSLLQRLEDIHGLHAPSATRKAKKAFVRRAFDFLGIEVPNGY